MDWGRGIEHSVRKEEKIILSLSLCFSLSLSSPDDSLSNFKNGKMKQLKSTIVFRPDFLAIHFRDKGSRPLSASATMHLVLDTRVSCCMLLLSVNYYLCEILNH